MKKESKITNEDIAEIIEKGFSESEKRTDKKIDDLARMVANGFSGIEERMATKEDLYTLENKVDKGFEKIDENFREVNMKLHDRDENVRRNTTRIERLEENVGILN